MTQPVAPKPSTGPPVVRVAFRVTGTVQGVGFRPTVHAHARTVGVRGWVANDAPGWWARSRARPPTSTGSCTSCATTHRRWPGWTASRRSRWCPGAGPASRCGPPSRPLARRPRSSPGPAGAVARHPGRHRHLRRLPGRGGRPRRPPPPLPVHELHGVRASAHDRGGPALRPGPHHHGGVPDVPLVPARVRRPRRPPLPRRGHLLRGVRPPAHGRAAGAAGRRPDRARRRRPPRRRRRGGEGPRRVPPGRPRLPRGRRGAASAR